MLQSWDELNKNSFRKPFRIVLTSTSVMTVAVFVLQYCNFSGKDFSNPGFHALIHIIGLTFLLWIFVFFMWKKKKKLEKAIDEQVENS